MQNNPTLYSDEQLMARLKFFIGVCLTLTLTGIVFVVLFSLIFVTQPLNAISPIDQKFFELIVPIATFLTGTLSGIMLAGGSKEEVDASIALMKQAQQNASSAAKTSYVPAVQRQEPGFSSPAPSTPKFNDTSTSEVRMINNKPAPPSAPQPEL
ncbi:MAG: hypothetical protein ACOVLB_05375 [Candidatus Nanopelagicus sp.]